MFPVKHRMCMKEKVKLGMVRFTGCSTVFHGKDVLDTEEKVRQERCILQAAARCSEAKTGWTQRKR